MTEESDPMKDVIASLRADYAAKLHGKLDGIKNLWHDIANGLAQAPAMEELVRAVHSLAGSGMVFGMPELGAAARKLELYLDPFLVSSSIPAPDTHGRVDELLAALRRAGVAS